MNLRHHDGSVELWLAYDLDDESFDPLTPFWIDHTVPSPVSWLGFDLDEMGGFEWLLDVCTTDEKITWLLQNGIAPGQPFRARFFPTIWRGPDYEGEYDCERGGYEIVAVEPWDRAHVCAAFESWLCGAGDRPFVERRLFPDGNVAIWSLA